ncbi:hypothetical protein [Fortiea contorta]|uniref:hypothetical protein n=1 Tax=Fortiea contorta TaxID=1892405 RepID=UPI00034A0FE6|nr:hypothetical protein [Fortiea contorta]
MLIKPLAKVPFLLSVKSSSAVAHGGNPQTLDDSLTLRYRPWRFPLGEDRAALCSLLRVPDFCKKSIDVSPTLFELVLESSTQKKFQPYSLQ